MANHKSAEKRIRQTKKRTIRNRFYKTRIKNITRAVLEAIEKKDIEAAEKAFKIANKNFHKYVSKGVLKKNAAARRVSRLHAKLNKLKNSTAA